MDCGYLENENSYFRTPFLSVFHFRFCKVDLICNQLSSNGWCTYSIGCSIALDKPGVLIKGTVFVILNVRFTKVGFKPFLIKYVEDTVVFLAWKTFNSNNFLSWSWRIYVHVTFVRNPQLKKNSDHSWKDKVMIVNRTWLATYKWRVILNYDIQYL